jgi:dipeptide transport system permease protein
MRPGDAAEFWYYFSQNKGAVIGLIFFSLLVADRGVRPLIAPHDPGFQYPRQFPDTPVLAGGRQGRLPLGTDAVGRDILSRLIFGARFSLFIGVVVVTIGSAAASSGLIAGYLRGAVDTMIMRLMDIILAFPSLLLALVLVAILGPGLMNAMIAIAIVLQPHFVRLTRAAVLVGARTRLCRLGQGGRGGHSAADVQDHPAELPGAADRAGDAVLLHAILDAAALGFLGMGAQPPTPEWGTMLAEAREFILRAWWVVTFPGLPS